ncbi:MAG TPA: folylpolyglutamate synthase/dihydrofolate synthase family protein [Nitrospirota bacterium]|jgi:dihydrofolate synthase/folylpolyglutamate synthase
MGFDETLSYLYDLQKFGTKLGLENTLSLMGLLDRPHEKARFLHVTGTNGKGSVSALASSALIAAGHRTGLYTSPHLVSFTERIKVDGAEVSEQGVVELADRLRGLVDEKMPELKPTFFEFTTAMAMDYFAREGAEVVVLEVGMGGRLDSTNVAVPECSVITNVELEHTEYLGGTIQEISSEKAGIIKPGVPLVTSESKSATLDYLKGVCAERGSDIFVLGRDFDFRFKGYSWERGRVVQIMDLYGPGGDITDLEIKLVGEHQLVNAATAACALAVMDKRGVNVGQDVVREGFRNAAWPGRLEVVSDRPLTVLDGAHNTASAAKLAAAVNKYFKGRYRRLILVAGVLSDKDSGSMLALLAPLADEVVLTQADYARATPADELLAMLPSTGALTVVKKSVPEAVGYAFSAANPEDMILIAGSLYVVGEAKAYLDDKKPFLKA